MSKINHLLFLIHDFDRNIEIYRNLFNYFKYKIIVDESYGLGVSTDNGLSVWVMKATASEVNSRDSNGLNHLAIGVDSKEEVEKFAEEFLKKNNIKCLFDTPKARPDFTGEDEMYYQVMFELPGSLLFEVVYTTYSA